MYKYYLIGLLFSIGLILPQPSAAAKNWTQTNESGFGDVSNTAATFFKIYGNLYAVTDNVEGVQAYHYDSADEVWEEVAAWGFLNDSNNVAVSANLKIRGNAVFLAFSNEVTGAQVWQVEHNGSQAADLVATQVNYSGFGNSGYQSVLHLLKFDNRILAYVQNSGDGKVRVLRSPIDSSKSYEYMSWEFMTDLDADFFEGLDAAVVFEDVVYIANGDPASVYTSTDGKNYTYSETYAEYARAYNTSQISFLQVADSGDRLFVGDTTSRRFCYEVRHELSYTFNGSNWSLDTNRPNKSFCYTHMVPKPHSSAVYVLGFDEKDGVVYKIHGIWIQQTADGFVGNNRDGIESSNNRQFSDGIWYRGDIFLATQNTTDGTQIWTKQ